MSAISFALAGLNRDEGQLNNTAAALAGIGSTGSPDLPPDRIDLSTAMVSLIQARNNTAVNVKVVQTADEMQRSIISLLG